MEEHRLKPMQAYDESLFNDLYHKVTPLKKKLASEIDCRRFGVDFQEVMSWFDVKILFVFQKYYGNKNPDILLGMIINSLRCFKCRILRKAYTPQFSQTIVEFDMNEHDMGTSNDSIYKDYYSALLHKFMGDHLSADAYCLFDFQLHPPPYILRKLKKMGISSIYSIPDELILRYFEFKICPNSFKYIEQLNKEIKDAIKLARYHFNNN